jgi:hypothetical protein
MPNELLLAPDEDLFECDLDHTPNAETIAAMRNADAGKGKRYTSLEELFKAMRG